MWHILYRKLLMQKAQISIVLVMSGISLLMVFAFSGFNGTYTPSVAVVDADQTELSGKYLEALNAKGNQHYDLSEATLAERQLRDGKVLAVVNLQKGFGEALKQGASASVTFMTTKNDADTFVLRPTLEQTYTQLMDLHKTADGIAKAGAAKGQTYEALYQETYEKLVDANANKPALTLQYDTSNASSIRNAVLLHGIIGFSIFFIAYSSVFGAMDLINERKINTWQRLLMSPSSKVGMILGTFLVSWVMGMAQVLIVYAAGRWLFGVQYGTSLGAWVVVGGAYVFAMAGIGVLISAVAQSRQQVAALTSVILTAFGMLGGCLWPLELVTNKILIGLSYITPHRYAFEALTKLNAGGNLQEVIGLLVILISIGLVLNGIGITKILLQEETYN